MNLKTILMCLADSRNKSGKKKRPNSRSTVHNVCALRKRIVNYVKFEAKSDRKVGGILAKDVCEIF